MSEYESKDIDRPLGTGPRREKPPRRAGIGRGAAVAAVVLVIGGVSAWISLREQPFRTPPVTVAAKPEPAEPVSSSGDEAPADLPPPPSLTRVDTPEGPSITRVNPAPSEGGSVIVIRDPSALAQNTRTAHLPDRSLLETSEFGPLPVRGADGRRPFDVYARQWSGARGARVAVVLGGMGLSQTGTQSAIETLPPEITLAFAPQGNSLDRWMQAARRKGHEVIIQVPLEPFDFPNVNPGRNTLTIAAAPDENIDSLRWALGRTTNYTGVMNYMGARFTSDGEAMAPIMEELGARGLMFLDDGSSARSKVAELAPRFQVPFAAGDAIIDATRDRAAILAKLDELERIARARGSSLGTGSAFDLTVATVIEWAREARKRGIEIVPASALAIDPQKE